MISRGSAPVLLPLFLLPPLFQNITISPYIASKQSMRILPVLSIFFLVLLGWTRAATSFFDDIDPLLSWLPEGSWNTYHQVPDSAWYQSTEHSTSIGNASLQFSFQGKYSDCSRCLRNCQRCHGVVMNS